MFKEYSGVYPNGSNFSVFCTLFGINSVLRNNNSIPSKPLVWDKLKSHWLIPNSDRISDFNSQQGCTLFLVLWGIRGFLGEFQKLVIREHS
jgi:hypothetical protein